MQLVCQFTVDRQTSVRPAVVKRGLSVVTAKDKVGTGEPRSPNQPRLTSFLAVNSEICHMSVTFLSVSDVCLAYYSFIIVVRAGTFR